MKKTIDEGDFVRAFDEYNRAENFSVEARRALYDYLTDYEEDTGEELELDPIAVCCEFAEYESAIEGATEYGFEADEDSDEEENERDARDFLADRTSVIDVNDGGIIIAQF